MQLMTAGAQAFAGFDLSLANRLARAAFDAGGGFAAAELLSTMLMFGDQQNDALIGRLDEEDPQQTVAERLVELAATLDGGLPSIMSLPPPYRHAQPLRLIAYACPRHVPAGAQ